MTLSASLSRPRWRPRFDPARVEALGFSVKTALAALMALGISLEQGLPMPFWAMTTVYIVSGPLSGATRSKALYRVVGTVLGAAAAVALVPWLVEWPELLSLALALWVGGCLAVSLLDRSPRSYMAMLAGYTAALIAFPGVDRPEAVFDTASARVTEIVLGITCATLTHSLLWPRSVADALEPRLRAWLADARAWHVHVLAGRARPENARDRRQLAQDAVDCALLATHVPFDTSHWREATASVQALLWRMLLLLPVLSGLADRQAARTGRSDAWGHLLDESFHLRDAQARALLDESGRLLDHLDDPSGPTPLSPEERGGTIVLHADPAAAMLSGLSAGLAILLCCGLWIGTGWADGGVAAALTGVFCCMFAALDNPVPLILKFGAAILSSLPLAGFYLVAVLPRIDGFSELALVLAPVLLVLGSFMTHPRWGMLALAMIVGFCSALAIQETYDLDFARFLNSNLGQVVAVVLAAGVTALLRTIGQDSAIARLERRMRSDLVALARATSPPDPLAVLGRGSDQIALIAQRLGADTPAASASLTDMRLTMNVVTIQHLRAVAQPGLREALSALLAGVADWFGHGEPGQIPTHTGPPAPPQALLARLDEALRLTLREPGPAFAGTAQLLYPEADQGRGALVALRRNLFPQAPPFREEASA